MFPLTLEKNIRELDRQISLLENECEHLEAEKNEANPSGKINSTVTVTESPNKPFVTGPSASASSYSSRMLILSPAVPKIYSASCAHFRSISEKFPEAKLPGNMSNKNDCKNYKLSEKSEKFTEFSREESQTEFTTSEYTLNEKVRANFGKSDEPEGSFPGSTGRGSDIKKSCKRSISSIKEVSESSDESTFFRNSTCNLKPKNDLIDANEKQTCELFMKKITADELPQRSKKNTPRIESKHPATEQNQLNQKTSSDEEKNKDAHFEEEESKLFGEKWSKERERTLTPLRKQSNKRRLRSNRTKKNNSNEIFCDLNITKVLREKEIQCMLGNEEKEKAEVFTSLCESLRTLYALIGELHTKSSREKINDVLRDMKNTLMKINKINLISHEQNPPNIIASLGGNSMKTLDGEEIVNLKKTLFGVTKFCQELAGEKSALTEELISKTRALANYKSKEKEYLSVISNLKFNLKKIKQEAEEGAFVRRDLKILKTKLQEETKVIEALRKSHEKMQELVQNYVLENDKLKAKVKISKLESQKFYVLLAGKEVEINKYKKDIESFQRQITEQLSLLRSKATENEVEHALRAISQQTNSLRTELDSNLSDTTIEKENFKTLVLKSIETTSDSSLEVNAESKSKKLLSPEGFKSEESPKKSISNVEEKTAKETRTCPTCKAKESESDTNSGRRRGLQRVLSSSKNLRSSINELLEDIRRETSEKPWSSAPCESSSQTTLLITTSSEEVSGGSETNKN